MRYESMIVLSDSEELIVVIMCHRTLTSFFLKQKTNKKAKRKLY